MEFIDQLERTKARTLEYFDLSDEDLERSYAPGKWTIRYLLNHLADSETVLFYRIRRVISEPSQLKSARPAGIRRTKMANSTCRPRPQAMTDHLILRRSRERYAASRLEMEDKIRRWMQGR